MVTNILNLIRKDLCALWSEKTMGLMFFALLAISAAFASYLNLSSLAFVLLTVSSYILNVFTLEEKFRTEKFFASLPVRRRDIVIARYGGILAIAGVYFVVAYITNAFAILSGRTEVRPIPLGYCATVLVIMAFLASFTFPFYFKLGIAKSKTITSLLLAGFMGLGGTLMALNPARGSQRLMKGISAVLSSPFPHDLPHTLLLMGVAIMLFAVSIPVAVTLYSRRDF
jgi:ABC-2 type transport system permease protein